MKTRKNIFAVFTLLALLLYPLTAGAEHSSKTLLKVIDALAQEGGIINCEFLAGDCTIEDIKEQLGRPDTSDYVKSAQGTYDSFDSYDLVVGYGKGSRVFELRSFARRIQNLSKQQIKSYFGTADHTSTSNHQTILSYVLNDTYNIKFVIGRDGYLDHYNVICLG